MTLSSVAQRKKQSVCCASLFTTLSGVRLMASCARIPSDKAPTYTSSSPKLPYAKWRCKSLRRSKFTWSQLHCIACVRCFLKIHLCSACVRPSAPQENTPEQPFHTAILALPTHS